MLFATGIELTRVDNVESEIITLMCRLFYQKYDSIRNITWAYLIDSEGNRLNILNEASAEGSGFKVSNSNQFESIHKNYGFSQSQLNFKSSNFPSSLETITVQCQGYTDEVSEQLQLRLKGMKRLYLYSI